MRKESWKSIISQNITQKYQAPERDTDDLNSIGIIGLIKAVMHYGVWLPFSFLKILMYIDLNV